MQPDLGVISINRSSVFTRTEVVHILPIVKRVTSEYRKTVEGLMSRLESLDSTNIDLINELEEEVNGLIKAWHQKIKKLGAEPKGLWLVDFDSGYGYYCWKFPESDLQFWHSYEDGFTGRKPISELPCEWP